MRPVAFLLLIAAALGGAPVRTPDAWIPARWQGGPLEVARRGGDMKAGADPALRDIIARWYEPATLDLLAPTPINCILVTWSAGAPAEIEKQQQRVLKPYIAAAHERGIAVLGLVYPGADPAVFAAPAADAGLEGLVLEGEFRDGDGFVRRVETAVRGRSEAALVFPLRAAGSRLRYARWPILAAAGVAPQSRQLSEMGIRAAPSSDPWLDSNLWLVQALRAEGEKRPVWLGHVPLRRGAADYARAVADAAAAGGRWIVAPDDALLAGLRRNEPKAVAAWRRIGVYLDFYERHVDWRAFIPYGRAGIVLDASAPGGDISDEILNLIARRHVPYRVIDRGRLGPASLDGLAAVLATDVAAPTAAERALLRQFADSGGLVVAGASWGREAKNDQRFSETVLGKGRIVVYRDDPPDPEAVSRDIPDLVGEENLAVRLFNVPSVLACAGADVSGRRLLLAFVNYATFPAERITVRVDGAFRTARLYMPEMPAADLAIEASGGTAEISIPRIPVSAAVLLER